MLTAVEQVLFFTLLPKMGAASFWKLADYFPSLEQVLRSPIPKLQKLLNADAAAVIQEFQQEGENAAIVEQIKSIMEWTKNNNIALISLNDERYPCLLQDIRRPPPLIYVMGDATNLSLPQVAIVGSRKPTQGGAETARSFASELTGNGFVVTSGLALGIDTAAHQGAVNVQGKTIAVLGSGIDQVYPMRNRKLADKILECGGTLVSEFPPGTAPMAQNFPQRNRIVTGLSYGTLVVEAAIKSGSLISARLAAEQNREVFAIPGSIHNPQSRGCHALIKDGAKLVETAEDIVSELKGFLAFQMEQLKVEQENTEFQWQPQDDSDISTKKETTATQRHVSPQECATQIQTDAAIIPPLANACEIKLLETMGFDTVSIDTLVERSGVSINEVTACLMEMEMKDWIECNSAGYVRLPLSKAG